MNNRDFVNDEYNIEGADGNAVGELNVEFFAGVIVAIAAMVFMVILESSNPTVTGIQGWIGGGCDGCHRGA